MVAAASSRDPLTFVHGAAACLMGWRLDAALSALTRAFIPTSLVLVNDISLYLEVGKNNVWSQVRMAAAVSCSPFRLVAADYQPVRWTFGRLGELTERANVGEVHPLPLACFRFETANMIRAFNSLRRGDHMGRYVATIAQKAIPNVARLQDACPTIARVVGVSKRRIDRSDAMSAVVQLRVDAADVATLQLNDPEHFNTFSNGLGEGMHLAVQHLGALLLSLASAPVSPARELKAARGGPRCLLPTCVHHHLSPLQAALL